MDQEKLKQVVLTLLGEAKVAVDAGNMDEAIELARIVVELLDVELHKDKAERRGC